MTTVLMCVFLVAATLLIFFAGVSLLVVVLGCEYEVKQWLASKIMKKKDGDDG